MAKQNKFLTICLGDSSEPQKISPAEGQRLIRRLLDSGQFALAATISMDLADQLPDKLWPHFHAARSLLMNQQIEPALRYIGRALEINPIHLASIIIRSRLHLFAGDREQAVQFMDSAVSLEPENSNLHYERAALLADLGDMEEARDSFLKSIQLDPRNTNSLLGLSRLPGDNFSDELIKKTEFLVHSGQLRGEIQIKAHFALAHAYDKKADIVRHFEHLTAGNRLKSQSVQFDPSAHTQETQQAIDFFSKEFFAQKLPHSGNSARVIFIIGFPRCGSTLVEQILSSHPDVTDAGETFALTQAIQNFQQARDIATDYPDWIADQSSSALSKIADDYMHRVKIFNKSTYITDKLLANFMFTGLIHLIFPNAKIIDVQRNPIDVCYSCYKRLFYSSAVPYTYDLVHLASRYRDYRRILNHWNKVLPGKIHTVKYEQLINQQEKVSRDLLDYCELPWNDACMEFHKNERTVYTHSHAQVRQRLYTDSIDRWKPCKDYLGPLMELTNN